MKRKYLPYFSRQGTFFLVVLRISEGVKFVYQILFKNIFFAHSFYFPLPQAPHVVNRGLKVS